MHQFAALRSVVTKLTRQFFRLYDYTARTGHMPGLTPAAPYPIYAPHRRDMMVEARWNGTLIASSDDTVVVEGNHYFPASAVNPAFLKPSDTTTVCPWKGTAHYHTLSVDGSENPNAAWFYPDPKEKAENIRDRIAFWKGVKVG